MASPQLAQPFPDFEIDNVSIKQAKSVGPLLVVVWRTDCPTCQLAMPFFNRIADRYRAATVVSIGQSDQDGIKEFSQTYGLSMESHADPHLQISDFLGVDTVPSYWLVGRDGKVSEMGKGWDGNKMEAIAKSLASQSSAPYSPLILPSDNVPVFKPG